VQQSRALNSSTRIELGKLSTHATLSTAAPEANLGSDRHLAAMIGKGAMFGMVASAAQIVTRLVSVPVVIHHLGLGGYGIWSVIMVTAAYMRFGSAGIKSAFQKYVAEATGSGDYHKANQLVSTGAISILALSIVGLIPVAWFASRLAQASGVPAEFLSATTVSIRVLAGIYALSNFGAAFEAIIMGGHRIDLTRKVNTILTVCEAVGVILVLRRGYGLLAMTLVMGASELIYISYCYLASHRVVPQMRVRMAYFTTSVFPELIRFAGSYQLVNLLELAYGGILPLALLKTVGADAAGIYAVTSRVVSSALLAQDALVLPILSGGAVVFASGATERIRMFLAKAFKVTLATAVPPLAFAGAFGTTVILAWTGDANPQFRMALWLTALAALLKAVSLIQLILYRASGKALLDNIRQVLRIIVISIVAAYANRLGFTGLLAGMAAAELVGVIFMFAAMSQTFHTFSARMVAGDAFKISAATAICLGVGLLAGMLPFPWVLASRPAAVIKLAQIAVGCLAAAWPALTLTKSVSEAERQTFLDTFLFRQKRMVPVE